MLKVKIPVSIRFLLFSAAGAAATQAQQALPLNPPLKNWEVVQSWSPRTNTEQARSEGSFSLRSESTTANPTPLTLVSITPCRLVDTRVSSGITGDFGPPSLIADPSQTGNIARKFPVPSSTCGVPAAAAYSLNFAVVPPAGGNVGFLAAWASGQPWPGTVILNASNGGVEDLSVSHFSEL